MTDRGARRALPAGPTPDEVRERIAPASAPTSPYIRIKLQDGPVGEVGVNGAQIDEVIAWCAVVLERLHDELPDMHTSMSAWHLGQALYQLGARKVERTVRGVEGTSRP